MTEYDRRAEAHIVAELRARVPRRHRGGRGGRRRRRRLGAALARRSARRHHQLRARAAVLLRVDRRRGRRPARSPAWSKRRRSAGLLRARAARAPSSSSGRAAPPSGGWPSATPTRSPRRCSRPDFPTTRARARSNNLAEWSRIYPQTQGLRRVGAAALDLCFVAAGWMDGYWELKIKPWDVAAGALFVDRGRRARHRLSRRRLRQRRRRDPGHERPPARRARRRARSADVVGSAHEERRASPPPARRPRLRPIRPSASRRRRRLTTPKAEPAPLVTTSWLDDARARLAADKLDGWLLADWQGENPVAVELLQPRGPGHRWFYLVTATGEPQLLCHADDASAFDAKKPLLYRTWRELDAQLKVLLRGRRRVAMEWSPRLPALSRVDGGTIDLVRAAGAVPVSSGDLVTMMRGRWSEAQLASHRAAAAALASVKEEVFSAIAHGAGRVTEYDMALQARKLLQAHGLEAAELPVVAAGAHTADPGFAPSPSAPSASPPATSCCFSARRPHARRARRRLRRPHVGRLRRRARARRGAAPVRHRPRCPRRRRRARRRSRQEEAAAARLRGRRRRPRRRHQGRLRRPRAAPDRPRARHAPLRRRPHARRRRHARRPPAPTRAPATSSSPASTSPAPSACASPSTSSSPPTARTSPRPAQQEIELIR